MWGTGHPVGDLPEEEEAGGRESDEPDGQGTLAAEGLDRDVLFSIDAEEHDDEEEEDDDRARVDDHLYGREEGSVLQDEEDGDPEEGHHQHQRRMDRVPSQDHPDRAGDHQCRGDAEDSDVDRRGVRRRREGENRQGRLVHQASPPSAAPSLPPARSSLPVAAAFVLRRSTSAAARAFA